MSPLIVEVTIEARRQAQARSFLLALIAILPCAAFLFGLDAAYIYGRIDGEVLPWQLNLSEEGALAEWFEYSLTGVASLWMARLWKAQRAPAYLAASATFLWLTLDNALGLHEAAGALLVPMLAGAAGDRAGDLGELIVFGLAALALTVMLGVAIRASAPWVRARVVCVLIPVAAGAGFGVAMDFLSHIAAHGPALTLLLDFVEDGGELMMLCLATALVAGLRFDRVARPVSDRPLQPSAA